MFERGTVVAVEFTISYPDGTSKTAALPDELVDGLAALVFHESFIRPGDEEGTSAFFHSETDSTKNPTMLVYQHADDGAGFRVTPMCGNNGTFPCAS